MAASACLRILVDLNDAQFAKLDALGPMVGRIAGAFLDSRWSWPKQYAAITQYSFMLTDPHATEVDLARLDRLAEALKTKLFGSAPSGDVALLLYVGNAADTAQFVGMSHADLKKAIDEPGGGPSLFGGRLMTLGATSDLPQDAGPQGLAREAGAHVMPPNPAKDITAIYRGVYCTLRKTFAADHVASTPLAAHCNLSLVDGDDALPGDDAEAFDIASLTNAAWMLQESGFKGVLYLPLSYQSLMRRSVRESYEDYFAQFLVGKKRRLAAAIYDAPRAPGFHAFAQFQASLRPYFQYVDLQVSDPGFEIDHVPIGAVTSVTLRLPEAESRIRMAALKRMTDRQDIYKRRQIWPAITNLQTRAEVQTCVRYGTPFISGAAVCGLMPTPVGSLACGPTHLPLVLPGAPMPRPIERLQRGATPLNPVAAR